MPDAFAYTFDSEADAAYVTLSSAPVQETEEVVDGVLVDRDAARRPVGIEVIGVSRRVGAGDLESYLRGLAEGLIRVRRDAAE